MAIEVAVSWRAAEDALRDEVRRVTTLLRSIRDPVAPAVGGWNLAETAMHLSQVWLVAPGLARQDLSGIYEVMPSLAGTAGDSLIRDIWDLADVTNLGVRSDPERDCAVLADRIEARAAQYFEECRGESADELRPWLVEGSTARLSTLTCYLLNETVVHGYDIARADQRSGRSNRLMRPWCREDSSCPSYRPVEGDRQGQLTAWGRRPWLGPRFRALLRNP